MGTKVHYRSYFPGHDKMRDLNADAGNSWPSFYISKTPSKHLYNGCFPSPSTGHSECDKEILKQTMLEHEAIFRKQVYELHRLYSIQKDLMEEFQKNGLSGISEHKLPSKTFSCSSQVQSNYATRMRQMSHLCANNDWKREKSRYNDVIYPVNFLESNLQSSSDFLETETLKGVAEPTGSFRKCPKKMLDFRLPVAAHIDDTERSEEIPGSSSVNTSTCSRICTGDSEMELKLSLVSVGGSAGKDVCKVNYLHKNSHFTGLADLNEPTRQTSLEGAPNSFPVKVFGPKNQTDENHRLNFPLSSTTLSLQNAFTKDGDCGERTFSDVFQGATEEKVGGSVCHNEAGKIFPVSFMNSTSHKEKDRVLCQPVKLNVNKVRDIISIDDNEASTWSGHEQDNHFLISGKSHGHSEFGNLGKLTSVLSNSFSSSLKLESNMTSLPVVPTWTKFPSDENNASSPFSATSRSSKVQKICSSDIATKDSNGSLSSSQVGIDLKSPLRFEEKSSSHLNGLNDGLQLQSHSTLQIKLPFTNINLNDEAENSFSATQDGPNTQQNKATEGIDAKREDFLPGLSWLKRRPACKSLEPSKLPSQVDLGFSQMNRIHEKKSEDAASLLSCNFDVFSSSLHKRESKIQNNQLSHRLISTKFITPTFEKLQQNLSSSSNEEKLIIDELNHARMPHDMKMYSSEKSTSLENNRRNSRNLIDLNSVFPFMDDPDSSDSSAEGQADLPSVHSEPILVSRVLPFIDLEAPVMNLEEDNVTSDIASTPFSSRVRLQEELCSHEMLIKEAAENIVKLSLDGFQNNEIQSSMPATQPDNTLHLFAEMILSNNNITELNAAGDCLLPHRDERLDLFELMTLQLEEMKPEKLSCIPQEAKDGEVNEKSKASLLLAKPRRVQGKKRRQKKDFQKDILPALATLSRQESMEDLQAIGELMKASGIPWKAGIRRRSLRGNSTQAQAVRKRRQKNSSASVTAVEISPPTSLFMVDDNNYNPELEVDRHPIISWGRTTRRCRSQRCPPMGVSSTLM
ncbi:uncharacterized protein LOC110095504 [Dendrobium catenatum]|uniref:uncharacterized protein LOC110095504 n=1 Tax=Dendrobium catenatum TaxID=906689 RepID=UPI0009F6B3E3|nr:uncharacterized protein LOC110095504 [Dendrobium catenatum]XP_020676731.1 uncharacterized protein LOC110095504 [Dendrobium catenatum]XP_028552563.1 uncharacterized protein LOC110095504 [Dendrobium catenatum]